MKDYFGNDSSLVVDSHLSIWANIHWGEELLKKSNGNTGIAFEMVLDGSQNCDMHLEVAEILEKQLKDLVQ